MASILEDVHLGAAFMAEALTSEGYRADFSPDSLWEIDRFFDEQSSRGKPVAGGLLSAGLGGHLFTIGAYVGEVIRRGVGGEWYGDDNDPDAEINVKLVLPNGTACWPVQRVMKRFKEGEEAAIAPYGAAAGLVMPPRPPPEEPIPVRPWWKFW